MNRKEKALSVPTKRRGLRLALALAALAAAAAVFAAMLCSYPASDPGGSALSAGASAVADAQRVRRMIAFLSTEDYAQAYALYNGEIRGDASARPVFDAALSAYLDELLKEQRAGVASQEKVDDTLALLGGYVLGSESFASVQQRFSDPAYTPDQADVPVDTGVIGVARIPLQEESSDPDLLLIPYGYENTPPNLSAQRAIFPEIVVNNLNNNGAIQLRFNVGCPAFAADEMDRITFVTDATEQQFAISWYEKQTTAQDETLYGWVQFQHPMDIYREYGDRPDLPCGDMMEAIRAGSPLIIRFSSSAGGETLSHTASLGERQAVLDFYDIYRRLTGDKALLSALNAYRNTLWEVPRIEGS